MVPMTGRPQLMASSGVRAKGLGLAIGGNVPNAPQVFVWPPGTRLRPAPGAAGANLTITVVIFSCRNLADQPKLKYGNAVRGNMGPGKIYDSFFYRPVCFFSRQVSSVG